MLSVLPQGFALARDRARVIKKCDFEVVNMLEVIGAKLISVANIVASKQLKLNMVYAVKDIISEGACYSCGLLGYFNMDFNQSDKDSGGPLNQPRAIKSGPKEQPQ